MAVKRASEGADKRKRKKNKSRTVVDVSSSDSDSDSDDIAEEKSSNVCGVEKTNHNSTQDTLSQKAKKMEKPKPKPKPKPSNHHDPDISLPDPPSPSTSQQPSSKSTPAPSSTTASKKPQAQNEDDDEAFASIYLRKLTAELGDDLDKVREAKDFKSSSLPMLIHALRQGGSVFSGEEKRRVVSVAGV
ncbi:hypothetical protein CC80DRAFT_482921 [Byssothecium circinans]|uniref:Ribosome assembly protein 3 n=1 Tax=Byssothecium circinans TaxID=147558 RepID=A0A6A5TEY0_9PLEO|nr:hypothetical protein CC80DRAFT_482921 [Byssothecium circinans]